MPIRMIHPQHGAMYAYGLNDVERLKGYGWLVESEVKAEVVTEVADVAEVTELPEVHAEPVKRKPGRPAKAK